MSLSVRQIQLPIQAPSVDTQNPDSYCQEVGLLDWRGFNRSHKSIENRIELPYRHTTKIEQILERLLTEMNVMREKMDFNQERLEAKIGI
jgi:hypothetical protein